MIRSETRAARKEALRRKTPAQVSAEFKVSRWAVYYIRNGVVPEKGLAMERRRAEIAAAAKTMPVKEVAAKFGMSRARVYAILKRESGK